MSDLSNVPTTPSYARILTLRQFILDKQAGRYTFLAYAFARGRTHASLEARVSEHKLPQPAMFRYFWTHLFGPAVTPTLEEVTAWLTVPEERIKRFGPRVPKIRKSNRKVAAE